MRFGIVEETLQTGDLAGAAAIIARLLREKFDLDAQDIRINVDIYSLNSLNGFFAADGKPFFFKFHQEENEEAMAGEYYRAGLLAEADEKQAQAAVYVYLDGMSHEEAAELLGVSKRTVGNLIDRFVAWAQRRGDKGASNPPSAADAATENRQR